MYNRDVKGWAAGLCSGLMLGVAGSVTASPPPVRVYKAPQKAPAPLSEPLRFYSGPTGVAKPQTQKLKVYSKPAETGGIQRGQSRIGLAAPRGTQQARRPANAELPATEAPKPARLPKCLSWTPQVAYQAYGYNHALRLENNCKSAQLCTVITEVTPQPLSRRLPPGAKVELPIISGSPAAALEVKLRCKPDGDTARDATQ